MNPLLLGLTALTLGLRHGVDIDHIAAILDMSGTSATERTTTTSRRSFRALTKQMKLPGLYVLGHGVMVIALGLAALGFGAVIPKWIDEIMERTVGVTLLLLSTYLIYSLYLFATKGEDFKLRSRWMIVFASIANLWSWLQHKLLRREHHKHSEIDWDGKGAFVIGLIHGIGAETGTQVLLFASVAGAGSFASGLYMLLAFTVGMIVSTLSIGLVMSAGLATSRFFNPVIVILGILAALFSLVVGLYFTLGQGDLLPSL